MKRPEAVSVELHAEAAQAVEAVRAAGLRIAEAAARFERETEDFEWALSATDPDDEKPDNFNFSYADQRFAKSWPRWKEACDNFRFALETEAPDFVRALADHHSGGGR